MAQTPSTSVPASAPADHQHLFHTPLDLLCPITLSLFQDPVCNALGQVYERAAIQRHLLQAAVSGQQPTDPVSNAVLPSLDLVPVWPMRSRAAEYRDGTIRACVQQAAAPECNDPVTYLRRAAELVLSGGGGLTPSGGAAASVVASPPSPCTPGPQQPQQNGSGAAITAAAAAPRAAAQQRASGGEGAGAGGVPPATTAAAVGAGAAGTGWPGLTWDFAQYLAAHQGPQHDALALKFFGNELLRAGCPDAASNVFYRLLLDAEDRVQQAEYLQLCLNCWTCTAASGSSGADGTQRQGSAQAAAAPPAGAAGSSLHDDKQAAASGAAVAATNPAIISKLAGFVQRQRCLSPRAIVQMLESTHHGTKMAQQLCRVLLANAATSAAAAGPSENAEAALQLPGGLGGVVELLLELLDLGHAQLLAQQRQLAAQVQQLQEQQQQCGDTGLLPAAIGSHAAVGASAGAGHEGAGAASDTGPGLAAVAGGSGSAARAGRQCRRGGRARVWRGGGKDAGVVLGRLMRVAATGTLAAASLAGGNHPVLRLARVGPLLYLLRAGL